MSRRLLVDSQCRHQNETPDDYTVDFPYPIKADSLALVASDVVFTASQVSPGCDSLIIEQAGNENVAIMEPGDFSIAILKEALQKASPDATREIAFKDAGAANGPIVISSDYPFKIQAGIAVSRLLGLSRTAISGREPHGVKPVIASSTEQSDGKHQIEFANSVDTSAERYLVLCVDIAGGLESPIQAADGATAVILPGLVDVAQPFVCATSHREFRRLRITITRPDGSRYNFGNVDHRLEFVINKPT